MQRKNFRFPLKALFLGMMAGALLLAGALFASGALTVPEPEIRDVSRSDTQSQNRKLSNGYAQMYRIASGLKHLDKVLLVKVESDKFEAQVKAIADYGETLSEQFERLAENYPSLDIEDSGLPETELKKRRAVLMDRLEDMAPIVGKTGKEYELTLLVSILGPINSMRFLTRIVEEEEKDHYRRTMVAKMHDKTEALYTRLTAFLQRDYFCLAQRT